MVLDRAISVKLSVLPFAPHRFFKLPAEAIFLDAARLVLGRCRPEGVRNASRFMRQAYRGKIAKRVPVAARPLRGGRFLVLDGNSTVVNCLFSAWSAVPALLEATARRKGPGVKRGKKV